MATKKRADRPLSPNQDLFVLEYLKDRNASAAYQRVPGYKAKGNAAEAAASRLLRNVKVLGAIAAALAQQQERVKVDADDVLRELLLLAKSDVGDILDFTGDEPKLRPAREIPERARRAIASIKVRRYTEGHGEQAREVEVTEFRLWSKPESLDKLGRHLKLFTDKLEVSSELDAAIRAELDRIREHGNRQRGVDPLAGPGQEALPGTAEGAS